MLAGLLWAGTSEEYGRLLQACQRYCTCEPHEGTMLENCPAHNLLYDQDALNRLAFGLSIRAKLETSEFIVGRN